MKDQTTFAQMADKWLDMAVKQGRIRNAGASEIYRVNALKVHFGDKPVIKLRYADGEAWLNARIEAGKAVNTINRDMKPLKWITGYAVCLGLIPASPFAELKPLKAGNVRVRWLTEEELGRLVNAANVLNDGDLVDIINVAVNTGFRKGNLERLTGMEISNEKRILASKTKSGKPYDVPVSPALENVLKRLLEGERTDKILNTNDFDRRFRKAAKLAGLWRDGKDENKVTIHTLRHTFAALYLKRGGDVYKLSKLLGHSSISVTEKVYAHVCPKDMDAQAELMSTNIGG